MFKINGRHRSKRTGQGLLTGSGRYRLVPGGCNGFATIAKVPTDFHLDGEVLPARVRKFLEFKPKKT